MVASLIFMTAADASTLNETWRVNGWVLRILANANSAGQWCFQIYVPHHDVGPWMGRETECEVDHPEAVALIARVCDELAIVPAERSLGDFRFATRDQWQRVVAALRAELKPT